MNNPKKPISAGLIIIAVFAVAKYFNIGHYLTLQYLHTNMYELQILVQQHYAISVFCYMISFIGATALSIPGSSIFTTAAGLLFGWYGLFYAVIAATIGATVLFLACRYFIGSFVQQRYARQLTGFNHEIKKFGHYYLLVIRLLAVLPFCLVTMLAGLTLFSVDRFIIMTLVGLIPVSVVYIYAGIQLGTIASPHDFFSPSVMLAFGAFIIFKVALVPAVFKIVKRLFMLLRAKKETIVVMVENQKPPIPTYKEKTTIY